jgi:hypothetical protein
VDVKTEARDEEIYKRYADHPHLRHALTAIVEARIEVKDAGHDFGGHREQTLRELSLAAEEVELAMKSAE